MRLAASLMVLAIYFAACSRPSDDAAKTPLPTRQTTIDPVNKKLDEATKDIERRRQDIDATAK
jgi:hypothetical protein